MALGILNGQLFIRFNGNNEKLSEYLLTFAMPRARTAAIVAARSFAAAFFMLEATLMGASLLMRRSLSL